MEFKIGDVVILKSGSPQMTVVYASKQLASLIWFANGEWPKVELPTACLALIEPITPKPPMTRTIPERDKSR